MYEPEVTVITTTSNIVEKNQTDDFTLQVNLLDRQNYPYVEHLIMDNASTDGTLDLLKEYKNAGYLNFYSEPDRGKFDAMNKGLLRAKGKYIAFLSCDDFYQDITAFSDIVQLLETENADFCYYPTYCCQQDGYVFQFIPSMHNVFQVSPCPRQAVVFKKSVLSELNGFDTKFSLIADYDLMIRLVLNGYRGVFFDGNVLTYPVAEQVLEHTTQVEAECSHIFYKNYKSLYPLSNEDLDRMVKISEIPKPLLDKLATKFPPEDKDLFYEQYQAMYNIRLEAMNNRSR